MIKLKKTIARLFLLSYLPFVLAMAFPTASEGFYMITGLMWLVFGTWEAFLLLK